MIYICVAVYQSSYAQVTALKHGSCELQLPRLELILGQKIAFFLETALHSHL